MNIMNCNLTPDKCPFCIDNICTMECASAFDYINEPEMPEEEMTIAENKNYGTAFDYLMESRTT